MNRVLSTLEIVTEPQFVLAHSSTGEFIVGDIRTTHAQLLERWNHEKKQQGLPEIPLYKVGVVSGIGFILKDDPTQKYVRLDVDSIYWEKLPPFAESLIDGGYTIVDATYRRISRDVDYNLFWTVRNDL